ncbi:HAMP domain-containing histidine kinase [Flavobacterium sp. xlx-214]|uniref:sensor histidine kinase n=1 Tax=unclassified Flavobacterium TaxID=196869 RepID=UPI0013D29914|nr:MULTISPECIES: HAMP domain-containing sensor histidine kinase [unclassified Flavobacterium]MBA5792080.1 HAMP domain-containing histidine kinase [Flavobacterium sp. xlx-221]QMI84327.1 HAMP domain-containing histidine kinase [Flavobacterium sp. xlx-214]
MNQSSYFNYRKFIHYALIVSIFVLLTALLVLLYNEMYNEPKLEKLESELYISEKANHFSTLTENDYITAQQHLQNYIQTKDPEYIEKYNTALLSLSDNLKKLVNTAEQSDLFTLYLKQVNSDISSIKNINKKIDSLQTIKPLVLPISKENTFKVNTFKFDQLIDSVSVETNVSVDSIKRKGLFSRLGDAISGKVDVQKETSNVKVTLRKGDKVFTGDIEEQLQYIIKSANDYYQNEFEKYKKNHKNQQINAASQESQFYDSNKELLAYSNQLFKKYRDVLISFTKDVRRDFQEQYQENKQIRYYAVIGIIVLLIIVSVLLIFVTRITFAYEKELVSAKKKIQQNLRFKDRIVRMISHEIRSPLNIISIYSKSLSSKITDKDAKESLNSIEFTTKSLSLLANQILDFSKNEDKKLQLNATSFNLKTELNQILTILDRFVETNENTLTINNDVKDDVWVSSDLVKIHQLFYNLVGNANKFTQNGNISITINSEATNEGFLKLNVVIKDNGKGISKEDLRHILKNNYQGESAKKVKDLGIGLGLSLCKDIVHLFNGNLSINSEQNVETVVRFNLALNYPEKQ